ncbi:accessory secretory protein Asp2 [Staphylococcus simulans]|uniref:accessory Sec system protein Asp2 n=2 Tax=Staphylococcus TaxID=1279 RepID=UPI0030C2450E
MTKKFNILQIGGDDLEFLFEYEDNINIDYLNPLLFTFNNDYLKAIEHLLKDLDSFNLVFIQTEYSKNLIDVLKLVSIPHNTYIDGKYWCDSFEKDPIIKKKLIKPIYYKDTNELLIRLKASAFNKQYGDKISPISAEVNPKFNGSIEYVGNKELILTGKFGKNLTPILSWNQNLVYDKNMIIQIWPEFFVEGDIELEYIIRLIPFGSVEHNTDVITISMNNLKSPIELMPRNYNANISITVKAKGEGTAHFRAVHKRWSRSGMGEFIMGGQRFNDHKREEFIYYFHPGDLKPPLNVYFSGYRTAEGFEGFFMMNSLNAPFLLIGDPRIEGGSFYIGSEDYENAINNIIKKTLRQLNFDEDDLILSGLSMGSFGALYYGAQLNPKAIVVGKPLVNLGTIAKNMRLKRPEDFGTSLDILVAQEKSLNEKSIQNMNRKFWEKFHVPSIKNITFAIAYMENDDYDDIAYENLMATFNQFNSHIMTKSVPGRHNDDSPTINSWFINFFHLILQKKFGR